MSNSKEPLHVPDIIGERASLEILYKVHADRASADPVADRVARELRQLLDVTKDPKTGEATERIHFKGLLLTRAKLLRVEQVVAAADTVLSVTVAEILESIAGGIREKMIF